ncbi:MAG: efflux RND transporter periplasmic adaptor subunit [Gammaproteobacteria bacterium]|nr:efflux RND transporter periplasmic adaptor subunit [Gammaproteobacteria bacterium]
MIIMLLAVGLLFGAIVGYQMFVASMMKKFMSGNARPPATVTAMAVNTAPWQKQLSAVGTLRAVQGVDISSEVEGVIKKVYVKSGDDVKKGDLLLELDADQEIAKLAALTASRELAAINDKRNREQLKAHTISQAQVDASAAELDRSKAEEKAQVAAIDKRQIRAPFAGRLGVVTVNPGQFINRAEKVMTLQNTSALFVDFNMPQKELNKLKTGQQISIDSDTGVHRDGSVSALNPKVDQATRNIAVEGMIGNTDNSLLPGMFVNVHIDVGAPEQLLTLPQTAVSYNPYGSTAFVADETQPAEGDGKPTLVARQVFVKTGPRRGDQIAILDGIKAGDMVVTSGQLKLKNGTPLIIDNSVTPANEIAPKPQEQ